MVRHPRQRVTAATHPGRQQRRPPLIDRKEKRACVWWEASTTKPPRSRTRPAHVSICVLIIYRQGAQQLGSLRMVYHSNSRTKSRTSSATCTSPCTVAAPRRQHHPHHMVQHNQDQPTQGVG